MKKFLNADEYNEAIKGSKRFNCFAGALSITDDPYSCKEFNLTKSDIAQSFKELAKSYGVHVREVPSIEEAHGQYAFIVLGFFPVWVDYVIFKQKENVDFHVFRINPDGSVFNKMDPFTPAKDLADIFDPDLEDYREELDGGVYHVFVPVG